MIRLLKDLVAFARERRKWWIVPLVLVCLLLAQLAWVVVHPVIAPFLYTVF